MSTLNELRKTYEEIKARGLSLDMTRGKPCSQQLDLANSMLTIVNEQQFKSKAGFDCRNYGVLDGLPEAKQLFAEFLEVGQDEIIIGGNASLNLMQNLVMRAMLHGLVHSPKPWIKEERVAFLCPVPGYDRHFNICDDLGIDTIPIALGDDGPDMDEVERLVSEDASIKGIWCVPKYSNPTGITYSDAVVDRLANMKTKAPDFTILWDNAYSVHHLETEHDQLKNVLEACKAAGNPERVFVFGSTSKISFAGAGISMLGASADNINYVLSHLKMETIGYDKLNQLRHCLFFKDMDGIHQHMVRHAEILKPKFDKVKELFEKHLSGTGLANWSNPRGGYFISLDTKPGLAKRVVALAAEAGVKLTAAGATFPQKNDPQDANIRIAPSLPSLSEIETAMDVVCLCIKLADAEQA